MVHKALPPYKFSTKLSPGLVFDKRHALSATAMLLNIPTSVLAKPWYRGGPPRCSVAKIINYVVANKAGPTLVATWQDPTASYSS